MVLWEATSGLVRRPRVEVRQKWLQQKKIQKSKTVIHICELAKLTRNPIVNVSEKWLLFTLNCALAEMKR